MHRTYSPTHKLMIIAAVTVILLIAIKASFPHHIELCFDLALVLPPLAYIIGYETIISEERSINQKHLRKLITQNDKITYYAKQVELIIHNSKSEKLKYQLKHIIENAKKKEKTRRV